MNEVYGTSPLKRQRRTNAELAAIDAAIYEIADEEHPISVRGLFYRVMSRGLVPKTEQGYGVVQREALKMRRAGELPYRWIADGSRWMSKPDSWSSLDSMLQTAASSYRKALWDDQDVHVEIWAEKDAISGVVYQVTSEFDVPLMVSRGFSSETFLYDTAQDINYDQKSAIIYQLGDHDPSGVAAWEDIKTKLRGFVDPWIDLEFERIAVTPEQVAEYGLPTRPTKKSDRRAAKFEGDSVEVDALPTPVLRRLVREAIETWIDPEALRLTRIAEQSERDILLSIAGGNR